MISYVAIWNTEVGVNYGAWSFKIYRELDSMYMVLASSQLSESTSTFELKHRILETMLGMCFDSFCMRRMNQIIEVSEPHDI